MEHLPAHLLLGISWPLAGATYASQADFERAVTDYHQGVTGDASAWRPGDVAIRAPRLRVRYRAYDAADREPVVELAADDGEAFTAGELLFKVHNAVAAALTSRDHHYFEGLGRSRPSGEPPTPTYLLWQGS